MKFNDKTPDITVNPETYEVRVNGEKIVSKPAKTSAHTDLQLVLSVGMPLFAAFSK